jgi:creatinine amidohydrolase
MMDEKRRSSEFPEEGAQESRSWALSALPWPDVEEILARDPRLIIPIGALIQHGPHLPLGSNTLLVESVAREVSNASGVLLAPTFHFGVRGPELERYSGSAGLQRKTLHRALNELLAEWEDHGVEEFIILTAHWHEPHLDALLMAMPSDASTTVVNLYSIDVGDILESDPRSEHAGELETSLILHLAPELVLLHRATDVIPDAQILRRYARGRVPTPPPGSRGILGAPSRATAEKGVAVFLRYIKVVLEILVGGSGPL